MWMEKDLQLQKPTARSSLLPIDTKENGVLSRKFFSDLLDLSSVRYRKLSRFDVEKKIFLQNQRVKAETFMPGLLPYVTCLQILFFTFSMYLFRYIKHMTPTTNRSPSSSRLSLNKTDQIMSSSFQSNSPRVVKQLESNKTNETLQPIFTKSRSNRQQLSLERINRLAQPKGRPLYSKDHVRSHYVQAITVRDLFRDMDDASNCNTLLSVQSKSTSDTRFNELVDIFSDIHEPQSSSKLQSVQNIVQSNPSLQDEEGRWKMANIPLSRTDELKNHIKKLTEQFSSKSSMHIIDLCTC